MSINGGLVWQAPWFVQNCFLLEVKLSVLDSSYRKSLLSALSVLQNKKCTTRTSKRQASFHHETSELGVTSRKRRNIKFPIRSSSYYSGHFTVVMCVLAIPHQEMGVSLFAQFAVAALVLSLLHRGLSEPAGVPTSSINPSLFLPRHSAAPVVPSPSFCLLLSCPRSSALSPTAPAPVLLLLTNTLAPAVTSFRHVTQGVPRSCGLITFCPNSISM